MLHLLVLMAGLLVGITAMNAFRRRNDYIADRMAVELIGGPEPLITGLLNLERLEWDDEMLAMLGVPREMLPRPISARGPMRTGSTIVAV